MKKVLFILFLFYAFTASGQQKEPIIDVHLHCYDRWGPRPDTAWYPKQVARPATTEALMRQRLSNGKTNYSKQIRFGQIIEQFPDFGITNFNRERVHLMSRLSRLPKSEAARLI